MKSLVILVLLLSLLERSVQEVDQEPQRQDELKELRDMVMQMMQEKQEELSATKNELQRLKSDQDSLRSEVQSLTSELERVQNKAEEPKVAFSVGLTGAGKVGPYTGVKTLVYTKFFCNVGGAYNPANGVFTAPTRGVYYFTITGFNNQAYPSAISMYHNGSRMRHLWSPSSQVGLFSNAVTVRMEAGDNVYLQLPAHHTLYDNENNSCTLTGFLLFSL